jgi:F-type H+-transporting ATPase subunit c
MKKLSTTLLTVIGLILVAVPAFAASHSEGGALNSLGSTAFAAVFCMGMAAMGGAIGQSRTAATALEGIARNPQSAPKVQTPMIIALAMIESLVLFSFVIAFFLQGKI